MFSRTPGHLTPRETQVITLVGHGYRDQEIADKLHMEIATVKSHVSNMLGKLGFKNRTQLAIFTYQVGMIDPMKIDIDLDS